VFIPRFWQRKRELDPAAVRQARLRATIDNASQNTRFFRSLHSLADQMEIEQLPRVDLSDCLMHPEKYCNLDAPADREQRLFFPAGEPPRTAVIGRGFKQSMRVRCFRDYKDPKLGRFAPHTLAGPIDLVRALANAIENRAVEVPPFQNAIIAFTGILEGTLTEEDRDRFWRLFEVPVFEQFRGFAGELLAWECEAHQGLHIQEDAAIFETDAAGDLLVSFLNNPRYPVLRLATGLRAQIQQESCPCGSSVPRLLTLERRKVQSAKPREFAAAS
jgi:hypothetical protein